MQSNEATKLIVLFVLFATTLVFSMLPLIITRRMSTTPDPARRHSYHVVLGLLSCFGGGVFLATCLMDLFPEVQEQFRDAFQKMGIDSQFPMPEFMTIVGCLLVLIVEQVTLAWKETSEESRPLLGHSHSQFANYTTFERMVNQEGDGHYHDESVQSDEPLAHSIHNDPGSHSNLRASLLVLALSLHSVFEGLAIGLQPDADDVIKIFAAVVIHKSIIAFTLGLNLVHSKFRKRTIVECNVAFSVTSPLGIGLGILVTDFARGSVVTFANGILQGLACGTFLYVTFFEVLPHELNSGELRLPKVLFVTLGFAVVSLLLFLEPM